MSTITVSKFTKNPDGTVSVTWGDGSSSEFLGVEEIKERISRLDVRDTVEDLILAWFLTRQPDMSNVNIIEGKTIIFDLSSANPIKVQ